MEDSVTRSPPSEQTEPPEIETENNNAENNSAPNEQSRVSGDSQKPNSEHYTLLSLSEEQEKYLNETLN